MFRSHTRVIAAVLMATAALAASASTAAADGTGSRRPAGYVYTLTNSPTDNQVVTFARGADGSLSQVASTSTNGTGTGAGLGSQGALALDGERLYAVNASSNTVSVLSLDHGIPVLRDTVASGGTTPISLTVHGHLLYVLNAGGTPNVSGFLVGPRRLIALPRSARQLS